MAKKNKFKINSSMYKENSLTNCAENPVCHVWDY